MGNNDKKYNVWVRVILTIVTLAAWGLVDTYLNLLITNYRAGSVAGQLADDPQQDAAARFIVGQSFTWVPTFFLALILVALWAGPTYGFFMTHFVNTDTDAGTERPARDKTRKAASKGVGDITRRLGAIALLAVIGLSVYGCGEPAYLPTSVITIQPNETAFVIPYVGATSNQGQFQSVDYLKKNQVAAKQIQVPTQAHQTGGGLFPTYEIIAAATVITVDRSPVSREWTHDAKTGSTAQNQAFGVQSQEGINFQVGATVAAEVKEEEAATFLYHYPAQRDLAEIMDQQVHQYIGAQLFSAFKGRTLAQDQIDAPKIYTDACAATVQRFAGDGITITSCGGAEGFIFNDASIQDAINQNFSSQQAKIRAQAALDAQNIQNQQLVAQAQGQAQAAIEKAKGDAQALQLQADVVAKNPLLIQYLYAQKYNGSVPSVVISGSGAGSSPFIFSVPGSTTSNK